MNKEEDAQKIVDIFFNKEAKVSKKEYNQVLEILENYISKQEVKEKIDKKINELNEIILFKTIENKTLAQRCREAESIKDLNLAIIKLYRIVQLSPITNKITESAINFLSEYETYKQRQLVRSLCNTIESLNLEIKELRSIEKKDLLKELNL